ncbi:MAG: tetratricopeptide repeat protein, partial [Candidatus Obscuribacterales bacterium]|nr:tetratricopeptide repeat protein [Candidatus Obscuribacterales bacterium]
SEGNYQKAIDDYTKAIEIGPPESSYFACRAAAYRHLGQSEKSADDWAKAIAIDHQTSNGRLGKYEYGADLIAEAEKEFSFVDPADAFAKDWLSEKANLDNWSNDDKKFVSAVLCRIEAKSPGLIRRAGNGQKILLMLSKASGKDRKALNTSAVRIMFFPGALRLSIAELEWDLTHELAHYVDAAQFISQSKNWVTSIGPLIAKYNLAENYRLTVGHRVVPYASELGLPTSYAASNPVEALAECTAAMLIDGWQPTSGIASFVNKNVLDEPKGSDKERAHLRAALTAYGENKYKEALDCYNAAIKLDSKKAGLYNDRAAALMKLNDLNNAVRDYTKAIQLAPLGTDALCNRGIAFEKMGEFARAIEDYSNAIKLNPALIQNLSFNINDCNKALSDKGSK